MRKGVVIISLCLALLSINAEANCKGHFVNPITDICWGCLFPLSIGNFKVVGSDYPDTKNPSSPIEICKSDIGYRVGLNIGYWEPFAMTDVTPTPFCLVNLGGIQLSLGNKAAQGGKQQRESDASGAFYYVHWYKYPVIYWLQIITSLGCLEHDEFDLAYASEIDPMWNDDEASFIFNAESALFSNPITQAACAADSVASLTSHAIDSLFWCIGSQGGIYPLTGTVFDEKSPLQSAVLLSERADYRLHRYGAIEETSPDSGDVVDGKICSPYHSLILPKSRYRYQLTNTVAKASSCYPFGHAVATWEMGHVDPSAGDNFGFLIFRKRSCTFL